MSRAVSNQRRRFVQGLAGGGVLAGLGLWRQAAWAQPGAAQPEVLSGTEFNLEIGRTPANFTGAARMATTVNGSIPAPILRWREGDTVTLRVTNRLDEDTSIHWHGILLPTGMDGVPGLSFPGIRPGETFTYRFQVRQSGTYWYHSHSGFQEQTGLYGAIVIEPRRADPVRAERDHVVLLSDWTDEDPMSVFRKLKVMPDYYNYIQPTVDNLIDDARKQGWASTLGERLMWQQMRMNQTDLADVSGATYTYLANGKSPAGNWTGLFKPGERVRLRFINGSAMTYFDVRIPGLKMTVVAADGLPVRPVEVDEFRIAVAETYDVIVEPAEDRAYTIFSQAMDRSGYARATLAPREGMQAEVPALDPVQVLTMMDMGMAHDMPGMDHGAAGQQGAAMDHGAMGGMDHAAMGHGSSEASGGMVEVRHPYPAEHGPANSMLPDIVTTRLDDPGVGLRDNGRKVLTYADLRSMVEPEDNRAPTREIELHLTGNMDRYMWSFNGLKFSQAKPIVLKYGERVRFVLVNDTMMTYPIHLHGLWSDLESPDGNFQVRKHTISLNPAQRISYRVSADARGNWAYHCHLLYHMEAGMFRAVVVE
ncbi:copper resistance system multicopper oxidase [Bordetella pertussis]|uniref:Copper resitance protein n=4 Tax=Bordetella pertussis TaxID=520 RepID=Q79GG6_BORPE|nr:copper resistance system multicopper oxidase [Bordetella pertussis]ETH38322.1 copper resistance protein A [Bordetella pertussis H918]ETH42761.1 copper resistance protein A [Bordetella pertussis H939]ETH48689.1 copper resistance protein A [Bordetella pertussis H921]ETH72538.1 copper resistance protein A [Bordetella pertussis STO1-CHLA-0011]ETH84794.1 copper resistance protein A [Bordetella pertussis STO1-CHOC-0017]ETH86059.1 copper resistance protein A [Bordetella pertussis STO1-CHOC-0018]